MVAGVGEPTKGGGGLRAAVGAGRGPHGGVCRVSCGFHAVEHVPGARAAVCVRLGVCQVVLSPGVGPVSFLHADGDF